MSASSLLLVLGVAENVVQFIGFCTQLCCRVKEYSVAAGAPEELVARAKIISDLLRALGDLSKAEQEALEQCLICLCAEKAKELSSLLDSLIDRKRKSKLGHVVKAWKYLHYEKKLESLQRALDSLLGPLSLLLQVKKVQRTLTIKRQTEEILLQNAKSIAIVPISRNPDFVGREGLLHRLYEQLSPRSSGQPKAALYGLGGVGKSQIALEYAYRFRQRTPKCSVFWVVATNTTRFEESYRRIASEYEIPGREDLKGDLMQLVRNWLESKYRGNWLMIVDNVDDVTVFFGEKNSSGKSLSEYVPQSSSGAILYTTRDRRIGVNLAPPRGLIRVPRMSLIEARDLLGGKVMSKSTEEERSELLEKLDYLPLAISQAAAFMAGMGLTIPQYLAHYRHSHSAKIRLLGYKFADHGREERPVESVLTTWMISFNYIQKQNPRAADVLALMSFLDRQGIPKSLLVGKEEDPLDFSKAIGMLDAFSLIETNDQRDNYRMHRLVQLATRAWLTENEYDKGVKQASLALDLVASSFPNGGYEHWATCEKYLPHIKAVLDSSREKYPNTNNEARATILLNTSCYFRSRGKFETAEQTAKTSVHLRQRILGNAHPDTLDSISNLASVLHDQGSYKAAEEGNRQALQWRKDELGKEALINSSNLASALQAQGRHKEAEDVNREALEGHEKLLGSQHPDTLASLGNLALVLQRQGKFEEAEEMHRRALEGSEKALGTEHPDTLISLHNLAEVLRDQAQYGEAEKMHRRALKGGENVLGKEHPFTLTSLHNLAEVFRHQGKYDKAEETHLQALKGSEKVLGKMHPHTLTSLHNLAELLRCKGRYGEAENIHRRALERREKVLGKEHIDTLTSIGCLALVLQGQGKYREAVGENRRALKGYEKLLGEDHPNTLTCLNNLALVLRHCCQYEEAEKMSRRALNGYERVLGKDHPDTLTCVYNLALVLRHCHNYEEVETELSSTERDENVGKKHPKC